jgi:hypothetical protein
MAKETTPAKPPVATTQTKSDNKKMETKQGYPKTKFGIDKKEK